VPQLPVTEPSEVRIEEPPGSLAALASAGAAEVAGRWPSCLSAWARLGEEALGGGHEVDAYAYFRVGYHRGLDRLRASGWRGVGRVPWAHEGNRGFLRSLRGLGAAAAALGEDDEARRCADFLGALAPETPASSV
jgi:hypothetical protein